MRNCLQLPSYKVHRDVLTLVITGEVILFDDASTDGTQQAIAEFINPALMPDLPPAVMLEYTLLVAKTNAGQAAGRNAAARRAHGEILFFLDADDAYKPSHIGVGYKALSEDTTLAWARTQLAIAEGQLKQVRSAAYSRPLPTQTDLTKV